MSKELEIEFKNLLMKEEYLALLTSFGYTIADAQTQTNHYFDTEDFQLKALHSALRIRNKANDFESTLKIPAATGNYEITDKLSEQQAEAMLNSRNFESPEVLAVLTEKNIDPGKLKLLGSLTTHRIEFNYKDGLLVLDHSQYCGIDDFEVEFEVSDEKLGQQQFQEFLEEQDIPLRTADKKIARFMKAAESRL